MIPFWTEIALTAAALAGMAVAAGAGARQPEKVKVAQEAKKGRNR